MAQMNKNSTQGMRKAPPYCAMIRGKRQMFPVPTASPSTAKSSPHLLVKVSFCPTWPPADNGIGPIRVSSGASFIRLWPA